MKHWFKYRLPMYWKAVGAWSVPVLLAAKQWYGDTGKSHYTQSDWVNLVLVIGAAVFVTGKANKPYVPPTP